MSAAWQLPVGQHGGDIPEATPTTTRSTAHLFLGISESCDLTMTRCPHVLHCTRSLAGGQSPGLMMLLSGLEPWNVAGLPGEVCPQGRRGQPNPDARTQMGFEEGTGTNLRAGRKAKAGLLLWEQEVTQQGPRGVVATPAAQGDLAGRCQGGQAGQ